VDQPESYAAVVAELLADPAVSEGQMMGMPALKVGSKMFGGLYDGGLVVKVGRERASELIESGRASAFDPSGRGRAMKDWAQLDEPADDWLALAEEAKLFSADG
jgi:TfoX/Sxy family transcriptional regulator of competence genes